MDRLPKELMFQLNGYYLYGVLSHRHKAPKLTPHTTHSTCCPLHVGFHLQGLHTLRRFNFTVSYPEGNVLVDWVSNDGKAYGLFRATA